MAKRGFAVWIVTYAVLVLALGVIQGLAGPESLADTLDPAFTATLTAPAGPASH